MHNSTSSCKLQDVGKFISLEVELIFWLCMIQIYSVKKMSFSLLAFEQYEQETKSGNFIYNISV